ncbi:hypothetical protein [Luteibacter yeojuensis]|uniref:Uncharacterized protein n=1 Tax=Luteibacter yeojuensis TaxID=345309 RepID=A0A7X5QS49_9GAMM|nr:hypothetical protein [Luteibacter yeojuensis]NID14396.1 hypothetical protein [Luteibacter yeojuensis]
MGSAQSFALSLHAFAKKAPENARQVVRSVSISLLKSTVLRTPVGNPDVWAVNRSAAYYNAEVAAHNTALRDDPENLTKNGRLKPGRKLNDGMDIIAPEGYVGGRLRANWTVSIGEPTFVSIIDTDKSGSKTIANGEATIASSDGETDIFIVNTLPYAIPIEYGHSAKQAPEGMVRVTVAEFQAYVEKAVSELPQ